MSTENVKAPVAKKPNGNKTTEIIIGSAASKVSKAVKELAAAMTVVGGLDQKIEESVLQVVNYEDKIGGLKQEYANKLEQAKIELDQEVAKNQEAFVSKFLREKNMSMISTPTLNSMEEELEEAKEKVEETVNKAVHSALSSAKKDSDNAMAILKLELEKKEASNTAEINQLKAQNKFLEDQVGHWKTMLDNQVKAETERAKYGQISTLNVGNPNSVR